MKKFLAIGLVAVGVFASSSEVTIQNNGSAVFLIERGLPYMTYAPTPLSQINGGVADRYRATSTITQSESVKLVYGLQDAMSSPACELIIQVVQDMQSKTYKVQKISATPVNTNPQSHIQCNYKMNSFDPYTGNNNVTFTLNETSN
jgi:hypothetical protein